MTAISEPIINILVVGFHHKKGCQVEYCFPPLSPAAPLELPAPWRHLPALALPDGSHNYKSDTIFFHLPGLAHNHTPRTVFGISCFRQIPIEKVSQRTADMTRSSVQKSVCVISREPLFGRLAVKLELVARAWFRRGDFCSTQLLHDTYRHLNGCPTLTDQVLEGLSVTSLLETWRHKIVLLFKLLLLQRKIVIHGSPAGPVSACLLSLLSLHPDCIQKGLHKSANIVLSRPMSPTPVQENESIQSCETKDSIDLSIEHNGKPCDIVDVDDFIGKDIISDIHHSGSLLLGSDNLGDSFDDDQTHYIGEREKCHSVGEKYKSAKSLSESHSTPSMVREMSVNGLSHLAGDAEFSECGLPLALFSEGHLCLPYLSLQYMDLLADPAVKGFIIGASNVLFKQKRQLFDVLIETGELRIETGDLGLRRQLQLSTEDLRFAEHLVRHGALQGDAWVRDQFAGYLLSLLRTSLLPDGSREIENFNSVFMSAFKSTDAYKDWFGDGERGVNDIYTNMTSCHPFAGQLSVTDMKLRLAHTMSSTESGRKVTQAVVNTGRAVASTSRVVGGALSQAKGALSVWWSTLTTAPPAPPDLPVNPEGELEVLEAVPDDSSCNEDSDNQLKSQSGADIVSDNQINLDRITVYCPDTYERNSDAEEAESLDIRVKRHHKGSLDNCTKSSPIINAVKESMD